MNKYAIIENDIVTNIVIADTPLDDNWVSINYIAVYIGDSYIDGVFYRDGKKVLSDQEINESYVKEIADMRSALNLLGVSIDG